jgi:alpha-beta hydrolase superfamily lysophospholipase
MAYCHGYGGHINRDGHSAFCGSLADQGLAIVAFDAQGHGYSEGEHVYIENYRSLIDDFLYFLSVLLHEDVDSLGKTQPGLVGLVPDELKQTVARAPLFVGGESMGGSMAMHIR